MNTTFHPSAPILIIDDEEAILLSIDTILQLAGFNNIRTCGDSRQAMQIIEKSPPSAILLDLNMPHLAGEKLLEQVTSYFPQIPVIIITGRIDAETAVECMKSGAFDYIVKPVDETKLLSTIRKSLQYCTRDDANRAELLPASSSELLHPEAFAGIITRSRKMIAVFSYAESIAVSGQPILLKGETGTGKELMAKALHHLSNCSGEFVAVNVAGLDDTVFSDTLFGHSKGAFTGAEANRAGLIERAAGGTLFLDEIGDLSPASQVKLLRLLQEREYLPLGQDRPRKSSARIITSTHVDLWDLQQKDQFRQDLHYRLRTHRLLLPPLRDRKEDIGLLLEHFARIAAGALKKTVPQFPQELPGVLESYHFPGNVRELQAMVFDAIAQHKRGILSLTPFRSHIAHAIKIDQKKNAAADDTTPFIFSDPLPTLKEVTKMLIEEAMARAGYNQTTAASMLGISQQALSKRLKNLSDK